MNKWMKIVLGATAALGVLLVIVLGALALFFDPNDYKPQINAAIEQEIGRQVVIDGPIKLSVFPWLGLELGHATVANADGFGAQPLAEIAGASASIRLLPLLARDIRVGTVTLDGLHLRLTRHADGQSNWQGILDQIAHSEKSQDAALDIPAVEKDDDVEVGALEIGAIKIANAAVDWDDQQANSHYRISSFGLDTGRLTDGEAFRMEFGGDLDLPDQQLQASFNVVSSIEPHLGDRFYRFPSLSLNVLMKGPSLPGGEQEANMSAAGEVDLTAGRFSLDNVTLQSSGATIVGKIAGDGLNDKLVYNGRLTIESLSPRSVMQQMQIEPPKTQDKAALGSASFDAQFDGGADRIRFKQIKATLDDSTLAGTGRIDSFGAPHIVFDLNLDQLNVDNYLPPGSAEQAKTSQPPQTGGDAAQKDAEFDLSALQGLHLDAKLHIGALTAGNIKVSNARVKLAANDGQLDIDPLSAQLYGGRLDMTARVDARADTPRFDLSGRLDNLQVQPLLMDVAASDKLSARGDMRLNLEAEGKQVAELKRSLSGRASFDLADGAIHGVSLEALLDAARRKILAGKALGKNQSNSAISPKQKTVFSQFGGHFMIRDGLMSGDDLTLVTPRLTGHGAGSYDIPRNKLDYTLTAQVPRNADGQLKGMAGVGVPVRLTGSLLSPSYSLDMAGALKSAAGSQLNSRADELKQKLDDKITEKTGDSSLGSKVNQGISTLFGGDKKNER